MSDVEFNVWGSEYQIFSRNVNMGDNRGIVSRPNDSDTKLDGHCSVHKYEIFAI